MPRAVEKLALAQWAFRAFDARCFWSIQPDTQIVLEEVPYLCERLRADGERRPQGSRGWCGDTVPSLSNR